jgi:hypothetical protein
MSILVQTHAGGFTRPILSFTRFAALALALFFGVAVTGANAVTITDNFGTDHDYTGGSVTGTIWSGLLNSGMSQAADANLSNPGRLTLGSANGAWENGGFGLLLYVTVPGDFVATVHVTGAASEVGAIPDMGLMARVDPGSGAENWVAARYFLGGGFNARRSTVAGASSDENESVLWSWLQLERSGNTFYFRRRLGDAGAFTDFASGLLTRSDMAGLALQVGIWQATFTGKLGTAQFDSFSLSTPDATAIPEPATLSLVTLGGAALAFIRRRRAT